MCACKTLSLISDVLQKPSRAGKGRDVLLALFLSKNCKQKTVIITINHEIKMHINPNN